MYNILQPTQKVKEVLLAFSFGKKQEGCLILTTCLSRESGDLSGATGTSCTSREVVNMRRFSETT